MDNLHKKLASLGDLIQRDVPDQQAEIMLTQLHERRHRQHVTRAVLSAALIFGAAGYLTHGLMVDAPVETQGSWPTVVRLGDGTMAVPLTSDTKMKLVKVSPKTVVIALNKGRSRFEVTPSETREVRVVIEDITVRVVGTAFEVARAGGNVDVAVMHGTVEVTGPMGRRLLTAGQSDTFESTARRPTEAPPQTKGDEAPSASDAAPSASDAAPADPLAVTDTAVKSVDSAVARVAAPAPKAVVSKKPNKKQTKRHKTIGTPDTATRWKTLAKNGDYAGAHAALKEPGARVMNSPRELLFAADIARRSGHPRAAVPYIEKVVDGFEKDHRAPMAAFSLGRIHLYQLGSPAAAAQRFAQAWSLDPKGSLAEDALAREAEAWSRAGQGNRAKAAALRYIKAYPQGRRLDAVKRFGGVE